MSKVCGQEKPFVSYYMQELFFGREHEKKLYSPCEQKLFRVYNERNKGNHGKSTFRLLNIYVECNSIANSWRHFPILSE